MRNWHGNLSPFGKWHTAGGRLSPFAGLMSTLLADATQLIAHPLEYGSMFQDRAGATPVTEPGQLVGMVLDHGFTGSQPVLGPELFSDFTLEGEWVDNGDGSWTVTNATASTDLRVDGLTTLGRYYQYSFDITTTTDLAVYTGLLSPESRPTGSYTVNNVVTAGFFIFRAIAGTTATVSNISVRELPGYHATAISDAARGVFRDVGGIRWVEYNGVNTAYSTPAIAAPGVDKAQLFAGARKLTDAASGMLLEMSVNAGSSFGSFYMTLPENTSRRVGIFVGSSGIVLGINTSGTLLSPTTNVLTTQLSTTATTATDAINLSVDGASLPLTYLVNQTPITGNFNPAGTYPLYYGARAGTSVFFNGRSYATLGPITRFSAANATAEQIEAAEAYYTARVI